MNSTKFRLAVIHVVLSVAQIEVDDVDTVDLAYLLVAFATVDVLRHQLGRAEEHALEIGKLRLVLHLYQVQRAVGVFRQHVHPVLLVVLILPVAFAFQQFENPDGMTEKGGYQPFQHSEVGFVAQQPLHRPIKSNVSSHIVYFVTKIWLFKQKSK